MRRLLAMLMAIVMLVGNVPVQAFATETEPLETTACVTEGCTYGADHGGACSTFAACTTEGCSFASGHEGNCSNYVVSEVPETESESPAVEPAADAAVYVTVSNRGELGLAYEKVTVSDINADGKLSVDEALYAAHTVSGKGYTSREGMVTQLWGVETTNVSFFVNHAVISTDVAAETISVGDYLVASVDQDTANDYDKYSRFQAMEVSAGAGESFALTLTDDAGNALAGMEIGLSDGNGNTTMTGLTTDVDGAVVLTLDQEGMYCVTARGTVVETSMDVNTMEMSSIETPIIAPVCLVKVSGTVMRQSAFVSSTTSAQSQAAQQTAEEAATEGDAVNIYFSVVDGETGDFIVTRRPMTVSPGTGAAYDWYNDEIGETMIDTSYDHSVEPNECTPIDALIRAHELMYGDSFTPETLGSYLAGDASYVTGFFERLTPSGGISFKINGLAPTDGDNCDYAANEYVLQDGNELVWLAYYSWEYYNDYFAFFTDTEGRQVHTLTAEAGTPVSLMLQGVSCGAWGEVTAEPMSYVEILPAAADGFGATLGEEVLATTDESGVFSYTFPEEGTYYLSAKGPYNGISNLIMPWCEITVTAPACQHTGTETKYTPIQGETKHTAAVTCTACGEQTQESVTEDCVDENGDNTCDLCEATLPVAVESITLDKTTLEMTVGDEPVTLTAAVLPEDAVYETISWSSNPTSVVTVVDGVVTAVSAGTATITAKAGEKTATCIVTVEAPDPNTIDVTIGGTQTKPRADAYVKKINIGNTVTVKESSVDGTNITVVLDKNTAADAEFAISCTAEITDSNISVKYTGGVGSDGTGTVKLAAGAAEITINAATFAGGMPTRNTAIWTLTFKVETVAVTGVELNQESLTMTVGDSETLTATVSPADATNKSVIWSSDNEDAVTVDENGVVTAVSAGSATITVTTVDGSKTDTCTVTVEASAAGPNVIDVSGQLKPTNVTYVKTITIDDSVTVEKATVDGTNINVELAAGTDPTAAFDVAFAYENTQPNMWGLSYSENVDSEGKASVTLQNGSAMLSVTTISTMKNMPGMAMGTADWTITFSVATNPNAIDVSSQLKPNNVTYVKTITIDDSVTVEKATVDGTNINVELAAGTDPTAAFDVVFAYENTQPNMWGLSYSENVDSEGKVAVALQDGSAMLSVTTISTMKNMPGMPMGTADWTISFSISSGSSDDNKNIIPVEYNVPVTGMSSLLVGIEQFVFMDCVVLGYHWVDDTTLNVHISSETADDGMLDIRHSLTGYTESSVTNPHTVELTDGKATVQYNLKAKAPYTGGEHSITVNITNKGLTPPVLKDGVAAEVNASVNLGEAYTVDLASIFSDAESDPMTYSVNIDGEGAVSADAQYRYTAPAAGDYALVFKAHDGMNWSTATYTVNLKVTDTKESYTFTANVPDAITPTFSATKGFREDGTDWAGTALVATKGESQNGRTSYTVEVPGSTTWVSVRGMADTIDWGGMAFAVEKDAVITLRQVNAIINSKIVLDNVESYPTADQAVFKVEYADDVSSRYAVSGSTFTDDYGYPGYRFLLVAADNSQVYTYYAEPLGEVAKHYSTNVGVTKTITTDSADMVTTTLPLGTMSGFSITAPVEATVQMFIQSAGNYYGASEIPAFDTKTNGDGTKTVTFNGTGTGTATYRVSMEGKITKAGYVSGDGVTVTWDGDNRSPGYSRDYDFSEDGYYQRADDSMLVNVNYRNNLLLNVGQTHTLRSYRIWQIINNDTKNVMIEPDFHINVLSGGDVISLEEYPDYHGNGTGNRMNITAMKAGTAVIEVTYDAIEIVESSGMAGEINHLPGLTFNACDPTRTALIVVQVGAAETDINFGILNNGGNVWDAEFDTLYFQGDHGQLEFNPTVGSGKISQVEVSNNKGIGWNVLTGSNGTYTANIVPGNNIIRITKGDGTVSYQIVRGDQISYTIAERSDVEGADMDGILEAGEPVYISLNGQHNPFGKMAGIYNPWNWHTRYDFEGTTLKGSAGMYTYAHYSRMFLTIPENAQPGDAYTLTNGYTELGTAFGSGGGGHRNAGDVVPPSMDAPDSVPGSFNIFPDLTITVGGDNSEAEITLEPETLTMTVGDTAELKATVKPADTEIAWSSSDNSVAMVSNGTVTAYKAGTATITVKAGNAEATCTVTVEPGLTFDIAEEEIVGYATVSFQDNGIRKSSELSDIDQKFKQPLGTIVEATRVPFKPYDTIAAVTLRLLDALKMTVSHSGSANSGFYLSSIGNFTLGETTYASFGEFDAGAGSGWMITHNGTFINKGASEFYVNSGDEIKWQYTCQLGADIGDTYSKAAVEAVEKRIGEIGDVTLDSEDAIQAARDAYDKLSPVQQAAVSNYDVLTAAEAALAALKADDADKAAAGEVINLIEAIDDEITENSKENIKAARAAYEALTEDQKKLVTNYDKLVSAEETLELLSRVETDIANIYITTGDYLAGRTIGTGSTGGEWIALGLARSGRTVPASYYDTVAATVKSNRLQAVKSTENSRVILALTAIGKDVTDVNGYNLLSGLNDLKYIGQQGVNGYIYALIALDSHDYIPVTVTRDALIDAILEKQQGDGGWSLNSVSEVDLTAMAIQALAPYYSDANVKKAVDAALDWLSDAQNQDGSFSTTDGSNAESIAQVIVALTALGIDPDEDSRFIKNGITPVQALAQFYVEGGGFEHTEGTGRDDMATEQSYYALAAYARFKNGQTALYDMSDVKLDKEAAAEVTARINAIGTVDLSKEDEIEAARAAYDALTDAQKELVSNYNILTAAETELARQQGTPEDQAAANGVKALIDAIGRVTSTEQAEQIENVRDAYEDLTPLQKNLVGAAYLDKLEAAEAAIAALEKAEADEAAAQRVENLISGIKFPITLGSEANILTVRKAYNALDADQKELVSNYQTLVKAEKDLDAQKSKITVTFALMGCYEHGKNETTVHTLANGKLSNWIVGTYTLLPGSTVKDLLEIALTNEGLSWKNPTGSYVESITRGTETLGEFTNGTYSGWMYTLNGKHPGLSVKQQTLINGDKVVFHYTDDYRKEEGNPSGSGTAGSSSTAGGTTNYITTTTAAVNTETAQSVDRLIMDIGEEITLESESGILAARAAYDKLTEAQKELVENYDLLVEAEAALAELKGTSSENVYLETGDYIQGLGTPGVGNVGGEWMVIGLARSGRPVPSGYYDHVRNYVRENINENEQLHSAKSSDNSRLILALTAIGKDVTNVEGHDLLQGLSDMDYIRKQGINGPIWVLLAFDSGNYPVPEGNVSREKLIDVILEAQLSDGGWALSGERSDPDMTGMALQALAPYMETSLDVKKAVEAAVWTLSKMQNDNGSFTSVDGPNSESIAQVIVALAALGIDADTDARFVKNGISALDALLTYYIPGGGFRHVLEGNLDGMSTEQAYYALVAYNRMLQAQNFLYDMTDVIDAGGDVIAEETTEPTEATDEPVAEETDNGNDVVIWIGVMTVCAAAIAVLLLNRKKLFDKFL